MYPRFSEMIVYNEMVPHVHRYTTGLLRFWWKLRTMSVFDALRTSWSLLCSQRFLLSRNRDIKEYYNLMKLKLQILMKWMIGYLFVNKNDMQNFV